jgi:hypothetical protein
LYLQFLYFSFNLTTNKVLNKYLVPEMAQPDVVLEVVMLCGQMLTDGSAAPQLAASGLANALFRLWQDQADTDAELQIQLLYTFFRFLSYQVCAIVRVCVCAHFGVLIQLVFFLRKEREAV